MSIHLKNFINVTRLNKPIGFLLLFWPCSWGLSFALYYEQNLNKFFYFLVLFFFGSVLMRSAGCIVNDIVDEKIDQRVSRTKDRPIASGLINKKLAWTYVIILCLLAFLILIQFNFLTICLGIFSMIFAFSYPYMKRLTYWPQLFLGFTFNWGIIMAWTAMTNSVSYSVLLLYLGAIFWTLGYDTVYGAQDISEDEIIGMKSTAIKFKKNINFFVGSCYSISSIIILFVLINIELSYILLFWVIFVTSLFYQVITFKKEISSTCLNAFRINNLAGLSIFLSFLFLTIEI